MESEHQPFPYLQLVGIVCASLIVTAAIFGVWHMVGMHALKAVHEKENATLRSEITVLTQQLTVTGSSSPKK